MRSECRKKEEGTLLQGNTNQFQIREFGQPTIYEGRLRGKGRVKEGTSEGGLPG